MQAIVTRNFLTRKHSCCTPVLSKSVHVAPRLVLYKNNEQW